jgi:biotin operon repressor
MASTERELITLFRTKGIDPDSQPKLARQFLESRTKVASETNYR